MNKTILITGWLGYIWSHAVVAFSQAWYEVVIVDNLSNSYLEDYEDICSLLWKQPPFYQIDLRDMWKLEDLFKKYEFDWVIHFAWLKIVWESQDKPLLYFDNNVSGSINLFKCMDKYNVKNIIFSSSANIYTASNFEWWRKAVSEDWAIGNTTNPYGTTKFLIEIILWDLAKFNGFKVMSLRYFNPIGAHPSGKLWENPIWIPTNILPYIMKVATGELPEIKVFWNDYDTVDGTGVRDYIDVNDLVNGHLKAYEKFRTNLMELGFSTWFFYTYNLWTWKWVSVLQLITTCEKVMGINLPYVIAPRRPWDLAEVYCDPSKAERELWWKAKIPLQESIESSARVVMFGE